MRIVLSWGVAIGVAVLVAAWLAVESRAQAPDKASLVGLWIRNHDLSDQPAARGERGERGERGDGSRGAGGRGRMGRGGFGGGGFGRGARGNGGPENRDEMMRTREALREIMNPGDKLTITQTDSMVVIADQDGRTTRLSPDGKKIVDENTHVERKTRWEAGKLISEISGSVPGKITQTFSLDSDPRRLRIVVVAEGRDKQSRTTTYVYDPDAR